MKRRIAIGVVFLSLNAACGFGQGKNNAWLMGGAQYGGITSKGIFDNTFDPGTGYIIEMGVVFLRTWGCAVGFSQYSTKNWIGESSAEVSLFSPFFIDIRKFLTGHRFRPFVCLGVGAMRMRFKDTEGAENLTLGYLGAGAQLQVGKNFMIEAKAKFNVLSNNPLGMPKNENELDILEIFPDTMINVAEPKDSRGYQIDVGIAYAWRLFK